MLDVGMLMIILEFYARTACYRCDMVRVIESGCESVVQAVDEKCECQELRTREDEVSVLWIAR